MVIISMPFLAFSGVSSFSQRSMSNKLNEILIDQGIRKVELARATKMASGTISRIAGNVRDGSVITQAKIIRALNELKSSDTPEFTREGVFGLGSD